MAVISILEFTDPACPWGFSAEPARRRLAWRYGDAIEWDVCMVGLAASADEYLERGFTLEVQSEAYAAIAADHGMPIDASRRPRMAATLPACHAVVAARVHGRPGQARLLTRWLSVVHFEGMLLDEPATIAEAARRAGVDPGELDGWMDDPGTRAALAADLARARRPSPEALAQPERLASWAQGLRYTCPSYEITRLSDGARMSAPGFQPTHSYEMAIANLVSDLAPAPAPTRAEDVLAAADAPLATREVAVVMGIGHERARALLAEVATPTAVGPDAYWTPHAG